MIFERTIEREIEETRRLPEVYYHSGVRKVRDVVLRELTHGLEIVRSARSMLDELSDVLSVLYISTSRPLNVDHVCSDHVVFRVYPLGMWFVQIYRDNVCISVCPERCKDDYCAHNAVELREALRKTILRTVLSDRCVIEIDRWIAVCIPKEGALGRYVVLTLDDSGRAWIKVVEEHELGRLNARGREAELDDILHLIRYVIALRRLRVIEDDEADSALRLLGLALLST